MSKIEWTERTWNPVVGCTRVSPGCQHCYAERMAKRLIAMGQDKYQGTIDQHGRWSGVVNFDPGSLEIPLKRKKPTVYFVNSMSDLLHEAITITQLTDIVEVMARTPWHTYQVLTKRAERLMPLWADVGTGVAYRLGKQKEVGFWPLKNVWLGVSVENQKYADERIPYLLRTPAAVRFLSCEPLLGPVDIGRWLCCPWCGEGQTAVQDMDGTWYHPGGFTGGRACPTPKTGRGAAVNNISWVIVGGESGPGARPMDIAWARSLVDQCYRASVPVFVKQLGARPIDGPNGHKSGYPISDTKGKNMAEWPEDLRVREFPEVQR